MGAWTCILPVIEVEAIASMLALDSAHRLDGGRIIEEALRGQA